MLTTPLTRFKPAESDILEEIAKVDASEIETMPAVERAAFRRELLSAIRRDSPSLDVSSETAPERHSWCRTANNDPRSKVANFFRVAPSELI